jgi:hypothetical protein
MACSDSDSWGGGSAGAKPVPTQDNTTQENADTSMPPAGFEPAIPVFERSKTVRVLDREAIGTGLNLHSNKYIR